ncbi:MAG TPA: DMT family transporter [Candidatus Saccharimonadales bacterium]|nr:DMT family transporter [Candidatus Saccharimonadales bacterium]
MTWQLLLTAYLLLNTAVYLFQRKLGQSLAEHRRLVTGFFFLVIHYPIGLLVAYFLSPNLSIGWLNLFILLGVSWVFPLTIILALRASKDVDAGHFTVLSNLTPIVTIVAATLLLHESLAGRQLLGAAIIIVSAFVITLPNLRHHDKTKAPALMIALTVFVLTGLSIVYERWMLSRIDLGAYLVFGMGAQTFWMALMAWPERKHLKILKSKKHFPKILGFALASSIKGICFVSALKLSGNASIVSAFISFTSILVVISAYFILKEKEWLWLKISAAVMGTAGLIILNTNL